MYRLDLLHAAIFDSEPLLTQSELPCNIQKLEMEFSDDELFSRLTPLLTAEQEDFQLVRSVYSDKLRNVPDLLNKAVEVMRTTSAIDSGSQQDKNSVEQLQQMVERFGQASSEEDPAAPDAHHLVRACHLNFVIFYNLAVHRIPSRHRGNQKYADGLFSAVRCISERAWQDIPYLRLWVLVRRCRK